MTRIPLQVTGNGACGVREMGIWEALDAYQAAFTAASAAELIGRGTGDYYVRQAALESVIADRMRVCAVISMHRALLAGVSVDELAHVLGTRHADVAERWRGWADGQRRLNSQCPGLGIGQREYEQVAAALEPAASSGGAATGFVCCSCQAKDTQIGSPRP
jgi:hypothetical protein